MEEPFIEQQKQFWLLPSTNIYRILKKERVLKQTLNVFYAEVCTVAISSSQHVK